MTRPYRCLAPTIIAAVTTLLLVTACHIGAYDTGDTRYSYLCADFVEVYTNSEGAVNMAVTDDGDSLVLAPPLKTVWTTRPDTLYRALLYYNKGEADSAQSPTASHALPVTGIGAVQVYVLRPLANASAVSGHNDAVGFQSCWMSTNKKYVNVALVLKSGQTNQPDSRHVLGLIRDSMVTSSQGHRTFFYRIYHQQNGVPAYYSNTVYVSIPTSNFQSGDVMQLTIKNSEDNFIVRKFAF